MFANAIAYLSVRPQLALSRVSLSIRHIRLSVITEVIFSGFELDLYTREEWAMIYWYAEQVLSTQVTVLEDLEAMIPWKRDRSDARKALTYISVQREYAEALRCFSNAIRDVN